MATVTPVGGAMAADDGAAAATVQILATQFAVLVNALTTAQLLAQICAQPNKSIVARMRSR